MIKHVLKDGRVLDDISGHKVTRKDNPIIYQIIETRRKERYAGKEKKEAYVGRG